ncbi:LacI family DNA-binding transcriptional regulator [Amnibacterium kyonggiense]|uniref:LacI family transcriptional regulator n=1 Tax=Amnibacterium kyonggiense TaxID=595671 RepID=A0A4V3EB94_9MICO|nr:LacI family DNA-binding transcriptional regulator [Amnibacterium kyonggiense]TDS80814.1 LacI family transcriptional regulator [Amnibacterium kyonggiense]
MTGGPRRPTRADVARRADVSDAVVSYVLSGSHPVSEATRARVLAAIEELGYRRNATARALRRGRSDSVGLVLSDIENPHFMALARAVESRLASLGQALLIAELREDGSAVREMVARGVDALLVTGGPTPDVATEVPTVLLDRGGPEAGHVTIGVDAVPAAVAAVDHLLERHGHGSVALVTGASPGDDDPRETGWRDAHAARGRPTGPVEVTSWTRAGGAEAARRLLERDDRPTAVLAASDLIAVGVLRAALDLGLSVPGDLAVVSYDGTDEARFAASPLTTIEQPRDAMAALAVDLLLAGAREPDHHAFAAPLVVRRSCGCPA